MRTKMRVLRIAVGVLVIAVALIAFHFDQAIGTLCALCPAGFLQVSVASSSIPWVLLPGVLVVLILVLLVGKAFCSWLCPSSLLKNVFGGRTPRGLMGKTGNTPQRKGCASCSSLDETPLLPMGIVMVALLVVSFIVKFPVFCLVCPIGLVFGTFWAVNRVFVLLEPGWELVIFPLMLLAELFLFRKWCSSICPLGFFFSALARARTRLGIGIGHKVNKKTCLSKEGCEVCGTVCPENIDAASVERKDLEPCTACFDCVENCPTKSISVSRNRNR